MDPSVPRQGTSRIPEETTNESLPPLQINPLSLMTALYPYPPIDDDQTQLLEPTGIDPSGSTDAAMSSSAKPGQLINEAIPSTTRTNQHTVAAWVQSTTSETSAAPIERSPSLPSTLIDGASDRSRKNSTVSTLCDQLQQASVLSDAISSTFSHNASLSADLQRSFSFPMADPHAHDRESMELVHEDEEDFASKFSAVPESEDSEIERRAKPSPSLNDSMSFATRSPISTEQNKRSSNVSFHVSVSSDNHPNPRSHWRQRRHRNNSWNNTKHDLSPYLRTQSHRMSTPPFLLRSHAAHQRLQANKSAPATTDRSPNDLTRPSPSLSDHVFQAISTTNSSSVSQRLKSSNPSPGHPQFSSIPSSTSMLSSQQLTSNISDASGQSGIDSTNMRTSVSEAPQTESIIEENVMNGRNISASQYRTRPSSGSTRSSRTASTESLSTSSSEGDMVTFRRAKRPSQTPADQRLDALRQLMWLLEKRPTIDPRFNLIHRKNPPTTRPVTIHRWDTLKDASHAVLLASRNLVFYCNASSSVFLGSNTYSIQPYSSFGALR